MTRLSRPGSAKGSKLAKSPALKANLEAEPKVETGIPSSGKGRKTRLASPYPRYHDPERLVWQAKPSKIIILQDLLKALPWFWLIIPLFGVLWRLLQIQSTHYQLSNRHLTIESGIFDRPQLVIEIYKIVEVEVFVPFLLRFFGKGHMIIQTVEVDHKTAKIEGIRDAKQLAARLRTMAENAREDLSVRIIYSSP